MAKSVALTGGTGFIGSTLLNTLLESGNLVRLLVRHPEKLSSPPPGLSLVNGDLQNRSALTDLVRDTEVVIHCAGRVRGSSLAEFTRDNSESTRQLFTIAEQEGSVRHFIYISSLAARHPELSNYAASKKMAEDVLISQQDSLAWTIIRPPAVYGPADRELRPLFDWMRKGILWVPGNSENKFSLLHSDDLYQFVVRLVTQPPTSGLILEPDDGKHLGYQWNDLQAIGEDLFNRRVKKIILPPFIMLSAAHTNMIFSNLQKKSPMLTVGKARELMYSNWVSDYETKVNDWEPTVDLRTGLKNIYS